MSEASLTQRLTTTVGAHSLADRLVLHGRSLGLSMTHEKAGGWFEKDHLITAKGEARKVRALERAISHAAGASGAQGVTDVDQSALADLYEGKN